VRLLHSVFFVLRYLLEAPARSSARSNSRATKTPPAEALSRCFDKTLFQKKENSMSRKLDKYDWFEVAMILSFFLIAVPAMLTVFMTIFVGEIVLLSNFVWSTYALEMPPLWVGIGEMLGAAAIAIAAMIIFASKVFCPIFDRIEYWAWHRYIEKS
jgi:hypothetical protein